ncbi:MAG: MscL family protein [Patescibacteria group bacterium]
MEDELKVIPLDEATEELGGRTRTLFRAPHKAFGGFLEFVRERGVMGLAIGFVLGSAVQKVVTAFVTDIVNPFVGIFLGRADGFKDFAIGKFLIGDFIMVTVDFLILCLIIYAVFKLLGLEKLDKPKT